jgi:hypothetical protein
MTTLSGSLFICYAWTTLSLFFIITIPPADLVRISNCLLYNLLPRSKTKICFIISLARRDMVFFRRPLSSLRDLIENYSQKIQSRLLEAHKFFGDEHLRLIGARDRGERADASAPSQHTAAAACVFSTGRPAGQPADRLQAAAYFIYTYFQPSIHPICIIARLQLIRRRRRSRPAAQATLHARAILSLGSLRPYLP